MTQPLEFRFALTRGEFARGARAFYARQRSTWIFFAAFVVFAIIQWTVFDLPMDLLILGSLMPIVLYLVFLFGLMPWLVSRQVQRNERLRVEMLWRVTDERISVTTAYAESSMDWGSFRRVMITPEFYLLVFAISNNMFQIVPKRALTAEQSTVFEALLAEKLRGPQPASA